jgi:hypothetical protein
VDEQLLSFTLPEVNLHVGRGAIVMLRGQRVLTSQSGAVGGEERASL